MLRTLRPVHASRSRVGATFGRPLRCAFSTPAIGDRFLPTAPPEAYGPTKRAIPIRKKPDFVPAVQRWSVQLPEDELVVGIFGVQSRDGEDLARSPFMQWSAKAIAHPKGPSVHDHSRTTTDGYTSHVVTAYWPSPAVYEAWRADPEVERWWRSPDRLTDDTGTWREIMRVPAKQFETIFWVDYPGGLMRDENIKLYPTPYCGYYGAMRDRMPVADNTFERAAETERVVRDTTGQRWRVRPPPNVAVIRSAHTWQFMDDEQLGDYKARLKPPLAKGMGFLHENPDSGCLSLRVHTTTSADGTLQPEEHTTAYFASLGDMEGWSEGHKTHAAIFHAAVARYKHYGGSNQLRTWHEVSILPDDREQLFEYNNCHGETGLLPYYRAERVE